jgi:hypothetical protein
MRLRDGFSSNLLCQIWSRCKKFAGSSKTPSQQKWNQQQSSPHHHHPLILSFLFQQAEVSVTKSEAVGSSSKVVTVHHLKSKCKIFNLLLIPNDYFTSVNNWLCHSVAWDIQSKKLSNNISTSRFWYSQISNKQTEINLQQQHLAHYVNAKHHNGE